MKSREAAAAAAIGGWYVLAYLVLRPLAQAPVADSWIYAHAVSVFRLTGAFRFVGYTEAMPVAQVIYGAAWSRLFGLSPASLDLSVAVLGALGGMIFYALARRCGARRDAAALATALLVANPCYLFLSFSFMTEIPFLMLLSAAYLAFASADVSRPSPWLWLCALLAVAAFLIRPFAGAAIVGCAGSVLIWDLRPTRLDADWFKRATPLLAPFALALALCALAWFWLTVLNPRPWSLQFNEHRMEYMLDVTPITYLRAGLFGPLLYLGVVLAPVALMQLPSAGWRRALATGGILFAAALTLVKLDPGLPATPEFSCCGGWGNALLLHGLPTRFLWHSDLQWLAIALGGLGAAGLIVALANAVPNLDRAAGAVLIAALCYWAASIPLWLFNDRYYLVLVPAGCLLLALAPIRWSMLNRAAAIAMIAVLACVSLSGVYDYQRGLRTVLAARDALERSGVPRSAIDAGYALNGAELYRYVDRGEDTYRQEQGIPMITTAQLEEYTIAAAPIAGTEIVGRLRWPGLFGSREIYVLRKVRMPPVRHRALARATVRGVLKARR